MYKIHYMPFDYTLRAYGGRIKRLEESFVKFSEPIVQLNKLHGETHNRALSRTIYNHYKGPKMMGIEVECDITKPDGTSVQWKFYPSIPF